MPNHLSAEELKFWESVYLKTITVTQFATALNRRCEEMADAAVEARRLRYARDGNS
jgi:hypothetical protein